MNRLTRRGLQISLGLLWILDAALQYQPFMFSRRFGLEILGPVGPGNPQWVSGPMAWAAHLTATHPVLLNSGYATLQLLIGVGVLVPRTVRPALGASIVWALAVWWLGEGLGGLLAGGDSPLMGYPGAVILYVAIAVLVWPRNTAAATSATSEPTVAAASPLGYAGSAALWSVLWLGAAAEVLIPGVQQSTPSMLVEMADGEPHWLASLNFTVGRAAVGHETGIAVGFAIAFGAIAMAPLLSRRLGRPALVVAILVSLAIWVVGEDFGGIFTGIGTDPNSGLPLVLLALCYWPLHRPSRAVDSPGPVFDTYLVGPKTSSSAAVT